MCALCTIYDITEFVAIYYKTQVYTLHLFYHRKISGNTSTEILRKNWMIIIYFLLIHIINKHIIFWIFNSAHFVINVLNYSLRHKKPFFLWNYQVMGKRWGSQCKDWGCDKMLPGQGYHTPLGGSDRWVWSNSGIMISTESRSNSEKDLQYF